MCFNLRCENVNDRLFLFNQCNLHNVLISNSKKYSRTIFLRIVLIYQKCEISLLVGYCKTESRRLGMIVISFQDTYFHRKHFSVILLSWAKKLHLEMVQKCTAHKKIRKWLRTLFFFVQLNVLKCRHDHSKFPVSRFVPHWKWNFLFLVHQNTNNSFFYFCYTYQYIVEILSSKSKNLLYTF